MNAPPLRLLPLAEANPGPADVQVRRATGRLMEASVFGAGLAGAIGWVAYMGALPWLVGGLAGGIAALGGGSAAARWRRARRPDAWLLAIGPARMLVNLDPEHRTPGTVREAAAVPYTAVESVLLLHRRFLRPAGNKRHTHHVLLEIRTRGEGVAEPLRTALARARPAGCPVWVTADGVIRIHLANELSTRPAPADAADRLARHVTVEKAAEEIIAVAGFRRLDRDEQNATLRALLECGEADEATRLAGTLDGMDLPHAHAYVRHLTDAS